MTPPAVQPVPPVPPPAAPAGDDSAVPRRTQFAALALMLVLTGLVVWRWCSDHFGTRPTELQRDVTHRVDLNRASRSELMAVPGIGPQLADRIVAHRESQGKFARVEDLTGVYGIGDATISKLRPWVTVDPADARRPNADRTRTADAEAAGECAGIDVDSRARLDSLT